MTNILESRIRKINEHSLHSHGYTIRIYRLFLRSQDAYVLRNDYVTLRQPMTVSMSVDRACITKSSNVGRALQQINLLYDFFTLE